jgi:hypothetical protein
VLHRIAAVGLAEPDRGREGVAGAAVVAGDLAGRAEPLVDLRRHEGELVLERERKGGADRLDPVLKLAGLGACDPLQAERSRAEIDPLRAVRFFDRMSGELDRLAVRSPALQVAGRDQALRGGLSGKPVRRKAFGGDQPRGERAVAIALELVDRREPALGVGQRTAGSLRAPRRDHLALGSRRLGEVAGELRKACVPLEHGDPIRAALALGPEVERLAADARRVAIRVHCREVVDGPHQRVQRTRVVTRREPVGGHGRLVATALLEHFREPAVEGAATKPGHVLVHRIAGERMAEHCLAPVGLDEQAAGEKLVEPTVCADRREQLQLDAWAGDRRGLGRRARPVGERARVQEDGVLDRLRKRNVGVERKREPVVARFQTTARLERRRELLDEERDPVRAVVEHPPEPRRRVGTEDPGSQLRRAGRGERLQDALVERPIPPQLVPEPPDRMGARNLVRAVRADNEERQIAK